MHTDPDDGALIRLPDGWHFGRHSEPRIACLVMETTDGSTVEVEIGHPFDASIAHKSVDLEGRAACQVMFWLDVPVIVDQATL